MRRPFLALLMMATLLPSAFSNDTMATLAAGGLVPLKTAQVSMQSENLEVSIHRIAIAYQFHNAGAKDVDATVAFPLPLISGGALENEPMALPSADHVNFVDFQVTQDGQAVKVDVEVRAMDGRRDVTARLKAVGLPPSLMEVREQRSLEKLTRPQKAALDKEKLIACDNGLDQPCWPAWQMRVQFFWIQHFPAGKTIELRQSYKPVIGGSYIVASMDGANTIAPYCGGDEGKAAIARLKEKHPAKSQDDIVIWENRIDYILTTANNWSGPIGKFHLTVTTESPEDLMFTCMPGLKQTAPMRWELERANFKPDKELKVDVLTGKSNFR